MSPSFADDDDGSDRPGPNGVDKFSINPQGYSEFLLFEEVTEQSFDKAHLLDAGVSQWTD